MRRPAPEVRQKVASGAARSAAECATTGPTSKQLPSPERVTETKPLPQESFVVFDAAHLQQLDILFLESLSFVVALLILNVTSDLLYGRRAYAQTQVTYLPFKFLLTDNPMNPAR